jgi:hypothetical protein
MLDKLPPELIDNILVLACPSTSWPDRNRYDCLRRSFLYRCCLVSKGVKERAQALLWKNVVVESKRLAKSLKLLLAQGGAHELKLQTRVLTGCTSHGLVAVARFFPNLVEVRLDQFPSNKVSTAKLEEITSATGASSLVPLLHHLSSSLSSSLAVSSLAIEGFDLWWGRQNTTYWSKQFSFTKVTQLTVTNIAFESSAQAESFFSREVFPSLRALALSACRTSRSRNIYPPISLSLLKQLLLLQINWSASDGTPPSFYETKAPVLHTIPFYHRAMQDRALLEAAGVFHLRICVQDFTSLASSDLRDYAALVASSVKPRSFHLPLLWRNTKPRTSFLPTEALDELLEACEKNGVEVVWCKEGDETEYTVSQEFWEYAWRLKKEQRED